MVEEGISDFLPVQEDIVQRIKHKLHVLSTQWGIANADAAEQFVEEAFPEQDYPYFNLVCHCELPDHGQCLIPDLELVMLEQVE